MIFRCIYIYLHCILYHFVEVQGCLKDPGYASGILKCLHHEQFPTQPDVWVLRRTSPNVVKVTRMGLTSCQYKALGKIRSVFSKGFGGNF